MNTYKYKEAGNDNYILFTTDKDEKEIISPSFNEKNSPGLYAEMREREADGVVIEPQFTEAEQAVIDQDAADAAAVAWIGEREAEYTKEGCTEKALIVALWEKVVENRPEAADALEIKRQAVKEKIKKP
jgi:DNA-binding NtrC family response regulator